jgi:hypothetical protein
MIAKVARMEARNPGQSMIQRLPTKAEMVVVRTKKTVMKMTV